MKFFLQLESSSLKVSDSSGSSEVCLSGSVRRGSVRHGRALRVSVWHVPRPEMELSCYLWCTGSGDPPPQAANASVDDTFVEELINTTARVREVTLVDEPVEEEEEMDEALSVSPLSVYHLAPHVDGEDCQKEERLNSTHEEDEDGLDLHCWKSKRFVFRAEKSCRFVTKVFFFIEEW